MCLAFVLFVGTGCEMEPDEPEGQGNNVPTVTLSADKSAVDLGVTVTFTAAAEDSDGDTLSYAWLLDGEAIDGETAALFEQAFDTAKEYEITVQVSDGEETAEAAADVTVNSIETAGTWRLDNIDLSDGVSSGTDGYEMEITDTIYTVIYTGDGITGNTSYGTVEKCDTENKWYIIKQIDDDLDASGNGKYFKTGYVLTADGKLVTNCYEGADSVAEAEASETLIWGPTAEILPVSATAPEITGTWYGTDEYGQIEYTFTATKFGWERFGDVVPGGETGGGDIISVDNTANECIALMTRHSDQTQQDKYFKFTWSPDDPGATAGDTITMTVYGPEEEQSEAEGAGTAFIDPHDVVKQ